MGEKMTLADVRDWHRYVQQAEAANGRERSAHAHQQLADAIDAHLTQPAQAVDVDDLAQEIRRVDGNHSLGAGALAEALMPFITRALGNANGKEGES